MIIGSGMLAKLFDHYTNSGTVTIFASGVSNSKETRPEAFLREKELLRNSINDGLLIYFSTTSILDPLVSDSPYVQHKLQMEEMIKSGSKKFIIFRLSQVSGIGGNPNTLVNALAAKIEMNEPIQVYKNTTRNIINAADVQKIVDLFISKASYHNQIINVATPWDLNIPTILNILENFLGMKSIRQELDKGTKLSTDISHILEIGYKFIPNSFEDYLMETFKNLKKDFKG